MTTINNPTTARLIVNLCGSWYDSDESTHLVRCPRLWTDGAGHLWVSVSDDNPADPPQKVITVEHIECLATVVIKADEIFIVDRVDYDAALNL